MFILVMWACIMGAIYLVSLRNYGDYDFTPALIGVGLFIFGIAVTLGWILGKIF